MPFQGFSLGDMGGPSSVTSVAHGAIDPQVVSAPLSPSWIKKNSNTELCRRAAKVSNQGQRGAEAPATSPHGVPVGGPGVLHEVGERGAVWMEEGVPWLPRRNEVLSFRFPTIRNQQLSPPGRTSQLGAKIKGKEQSHGRCPSCVGPSGELATKLESGRP